MKTETQFSYKEFLVICFIVVSAFFIVIFDTKPVYAEPEAPEIRRIAVMPFLKGKKPDNIDTLMSCSPDQLCLEPIDFAPGSERIMTRIINQALTLRYGERVLIQTDVDVAFDKIKNTEAESTALLLATKLGKDLNIGYVVIGNVWKFRNRSGSALASEQGASVAFNLHLIDIDKGVRIWKETFISTQQSLSDNILKSVDFFKQGARWLTAEELARFGVNDVLKQFPLKN